MTQAADDPDGIRRISAALQSVWDATRAEHADIPAAVVAIQPPGPGRAPQAHYTAEWWSPESPALVIPGRVVTGDDPGRAAVHDVLHQAAHALAAARGIADTSAASGLYHNLEYVTLAAQVGLAFPAERPGRKKRSGYNVPPLTPAAEGRPAIAAAIAAIDAAAADYRAANDRARAARGGRRLAALCECPEPRTIQLTPRQLDEGSIRCGVCGADFRPREDARSS